ncbi:MAG: hypothetical protein JW922_03005 [Paludibacteraceae bacterium]|nr:hypothetical protein [Paludibacteraceae bacterium]
MGLKALITLDLPNVTEDQRNLFYQSLTENRWTKINCLTTAWKASFNDNVNKNNALIVLENDLQSAKTSSGVRRVEYAIQLSLDDVKIATM